MTREEAINILEEIIDEGWLISDYDKCPAIDACEMAIKALEQEPCEDVISRKSIKQKLQEHHDFFVNAYGGFSNLPLNDKSRVDEITNCIAMVVNEPSVTPQEPKTGHWIGTRRVGCAFGEYKEYIVPIKDGIVTDSCHCSECGEWLTGSDEYECYGNYCPKCGAKMESEVEDGNDATNAESN